MRLSDTDVSEHVWTLDSKKKTDETDCEVMSAAVQRDLWIHTNDLGRRSVPGDTLKHLLLLGQRSGSPCLPPSTSTGGFTKGDELYCKHHIPPGSSSGPVNITEGVCVCVCVSMCMYERDKKDDRQRKYYNQALVFRIFSSQITLKLWYSLFL